ncbi:MAG: AsmA-like C-terminal domain-containing protein [Mariprofundaceae bacterium]|nr:AsmA-like C-terminal domain-containing protein [Mariprofundaceae bacterium]
MSMLQLCLFRACRIALMLLLALIVAIVALCYAAVDLNFMKPMVEKALKTQLQTEHVSVSQLQLIWDAGPSLDMGVIELQNPQLSLEHTQAVLSFSFSGVFQGVVAPRLLLRDGYLSLKLDKQAKNQVNQQLQAPHMQLELDDMRLTFSFADTPITLQHVTAHISPLLSDMQLQADGLQLSAAFDQAMQLQRLHVQVEDFTWLPQAWLLYVKNLKKVDMSAQMTRSNTWQWQVHALANQGQIQFEDAHLEIPFERLEGQGELSLETSESLELLRFEASEISWLDGDNFAEFKLLWFENVLNLEIMDGQATMPMLWSWLWQLSDGDAWHQWLSSMQYGVLKDVQATLRLPWKNPLSAAPAAADIEQLTYHVLTDVQDADIALGVDSDFLYHTDAAVEIDQDHLTAKIITADLGLHLGRLHGDYNIAWDTLLMHIDAKGVVDVGKLHLWLDEDVARELAWQPSAAYARVKMAWNAEKSAPDAMLLYLKPKGDWQLQPKGVALKLQGGLAILDLQRGLRLQDMRFESPWFAGDMQMFIQHDKARWALEELHINATAALSELTQEFSLPINDAEGSTALLLDFKRGDWSGSLDFSAADWSSFLGYDKQVDERFMLSFSGQSAAQTLMPIKLDKWTSNHATFNIHGAVTFSEHHVDMMFKDIVTPQYHGDIRLLFPWDETLPWGIEAHADAVDKAAFSSYMADDEEENRQTSSRPWSLYADIGRLTWDSSYAQQVLLQYESNQHSTLSFTAAHLLSGDADLEQVHASLSMLEDGRLDLHVLEADGSGQHLLVSGSLQPLPSGLLQWQGMVVMDGKFGTLMHQAELDKLFQQGEMHAVFLGGGEFTVGESWWQGMQGRFRLRVDDGRIMQGGTLVRLLAAISLVDLPKFLIFQRDDMVGEGLLYDSMQLEAEFLRGKLHINQLLLQSSALDAAGRGEIDLASGAIDILLVVRPWQNIEAILGAIPLLGTILTGKDKSLLRKVYRIHGPASDAQVDELEPKDAGLPQSGLLEQLFSLPSTWFGKNKGE